jgi:formylglycine-generating enzyme required for sulfatase activity
LAADAKICGGPHLAPLFDPSNATPAEAQVCIDRYEFPNVPCEYPLIWTRASEAAALCEAVGKRLCDAHEWEGACAGALEPPDYRFDLATGRDASSAVKAMRDAHNAKYRGDKSWAFSKALGVNAYTPGVCAAASTKSPGCDGGNFAACGSNTYPAGAFPRCVSPLGVYDLHGNAAEHMNLPLAPDQMASAGSRNAQNKLGVTEMKGSWFIFDRYYAHEDWCRWRAPYWHGSRVRDAESHHNYHLGFRCCRSVGGDPASQTH